LVGQWGKEIIFGLDYLHTNNIIHRDIKPALVIFILKVLWQINLLFNYFERNIFLKNNKIKLGDLGEAKIISEEETMTVRGSQPYMSPEMHKKYGDRSVVITFKTDVW
jgi:serine/threonine protein kinase